MPIGKIGEQLIHYQRLAGEPEVVAIHGLMANLAFWYLGLLPHLDGLGLTAFDLRGHGLSGRPQAGYTTAHMAGDVVGLLNHLGIERANLVGHSFGGAVALHTAILYPDRVRSLVLADARVSCLQPPLTEPTARQWEMLRRRLRRFGMELPGNAPRVSYTLYQELARSLVGQPGTSKGKEGGVRTNYLRRSQANKKTIRQWLRLVQTTAAHRDFRVVGSLTVDCISRIPHPTLAIFGEHSNCIPSLRGLQRYLPNCKTVIVRGGGHLHPVAEPKFFAECLNEFVTDLPQ